MSLNIDQSDIIQSILSSIKNDTTKSDEEKLKLIEYLESQTKFKRSTDTEIVSCPFCREKLLPKMIDCKPPKIDIPDPSIISDIYQSGVSRRESISIVIPQPTKNDIISSDNFTTILEHLGLKPYIDKE